MFRFLKWGTVKKSGDASSGRTNGVREAEIAEIINGVAETLAKSCLYFSPGNLAILGTAPDVPAMLERMDPLLRMALIDGKMHHEQQLDFSAFAERAGDLKAGAEAARLAAQIFRLLHDAETPSSGLVPLKRVTDSALRTLRTSASAVSTGDPAAAQMALQSLVETEEIGKEVLDIVRNLAAYHSPTICRLIEAALYAVLVAAQTVAEASSQLLLPTSEKVETLQLLEEPILGVQPKIPGFQNDVICMPGATKKRRL